MSDSTPPHRPRPSPVARVSRRYSRTRPARRHGVFDRDAIHRFRARVRIACVYRSSCVVRRASCVARRRHDDGGHQSRARDDDEEEESRVTMRGRDRGRISRPIVSALESIARGMARGACASRVRGTRTRRRGRCRVVCTRCLARTTRSSGDDDDGDGDARAATRERSRVAEPSAGWFEREGGRKGEGLEGDGTRGVCSACDWCHHRAYCVCVLCV